MKLVYKVMVVLIILIWSIFSILYVDYKHVDLLLGKYKTYDVMLADHSNNKENTKLVEQIYNDYRESDQLIIYNYQTIENNQLFTKIITNRPDVLSDKLVNDATVEVLPFSKLKEVKGERIPIYVPNDFEVDNGNYDYTSNQISDGNILINSWYGASGLLISGVGLLTIILVTLLYEEREANRLRILMFDGNKLSYIYKHMFLKSHIFVVSVSFVLLLILVNFSKLLYWWIFIYYIIYLVVVIAMSFLSLKYVYCNYQLKLSKLKIINFLFQAIFIMIIVVLVHFIGDTISLYTRLQPNQEFVQISENLEGYETFNQSPSGESTLDYDTAATLYTDYYNFLNENFDVVVAQPTTSDLDVDNPLILVNQSYFDVFNVMDAQGEVLTSDQFKDDRAYSLSSTGYIFEWNLTSDEVTFDNKELAPGQEIWYVDGSMSMYGAHPITDANLLVMPNVISQDFIKEYSVYNWINWTMSSNSVLVKQASQSKLNQQYLKEHGLDTTFRDWSSVNENYERSLNGIYKKIALYQKIAAVGIIVVIIFTLLDVYIYLYLNKKKLAIQILDGNRGFYLIRPYAQSLIIKLVIVGFASSQVLHLRFIPTVMSELIIFIVQIMILLAGVKYITMSTIKLIRGER